jgi:glycosyltransferase involved in cell wall biosynthesis
MSVIEISVVVPVCNEERQVAPFVAALRRVLGDVPFELLFVDDGSSDGTWAAIHGLREEDSRVGGLRLTRNFGKEAAVWSGIEIARGKAVLVMDVDLQHPPTLIPEMIALWKSGQWKIVEARKRHRGREPFWYRSFSRLFYSILQWGTGFDLAGATDFKLLDRQAVDVLKTLPERITFFRGICSWTGLPRTTVEFEVPDAGRPTRWNVLRLTKLGVDAITSFTPWPLFLVALAGVVFAVFSILLGIDTLFMYFSGRAVTGFTTVILLMLIVGAVIMFGLAIVGLYISRLFDEVKGRPRAVAMEVLPSQKEIF